MDRTLIDAALRSIPDPEMPISIVDLGLVESVQIEPIQPAPGGDVRVAVQLLPTFVGCPALDMIAREVRLRLGAIPGVADVTVNWQFEPRWSVDRITEQGRADLKAHGVTVPEQGGCCAGPSHKETSGTLATVELRTSIIPCPFCGSRSTTLESPFGPTRCRMIYYCNACRNTFEHLKRV